MYIQRNGYTERVWKITYQNKGFDMTVLIQGTEPEMWDYTESEFGYTGSYYALDEDDVRQCKAMGFKIYIAPKL